MYDVYIKRYKNYNGNIVNAEAKIISIPSTPENGFPISRPQVKQSEDNADSFDFSVEMSSPYYNYFLQFKTKVRVEYDGTTIFCGRVLTIDDQSVYQTKIIHCEGAYGYMNDTHYEAKQEKTKTKMTWSAYYDRIFSNHNNMIRTNDPDKVINRGTVTVDGSTAFTPTTEQQKFEPSSWTKSMGLISNLVKEYGGHIKTRYENGNIYLDWYKYYARDLGANRPTVEVGKNILDISATSNTDNIFTWVTPIGGSSSSGAPIYVDGYKYTDKNGTQHTYSGKSLPVSIVRSLYTDNQLTDEFHSPSDYSNAQSDFGVIYKDQKFDGAKTQAQLWSYATKWIKESYYGLASSFSVSAYDMHITDPSKSKILLGDCVNVKYYTIENGERVLKNKKLVCKAVTFDLFNPENNQYTFGIPSEILNRTFSEGRGKGGSDNAAGGGGGGGGGGDNTEPDQSFSGIALLIRDTNDEVYGGNAAADSFVANGECSGTVKCYDPAETDDPRNHPELCFTAQVVGKLTHHGPTKWIAVSSVKGIFAFQSGGGDRTDAQRVTFWYSRKSGFTYTGFSAFMTDAEKETAELLAGYGVKIQTSDELREFIEVFPDRVEAWSKQPEIQGAINVLVSPIQGIFEANKIAAGGVVNTLLKFFFGGSGGKIEAGNGNKTNPNTHNVVIDGESNKIDLGITNSLGTWVSNIFLAGNTGTAAVGNDNGSWKVFLNDTVTYQDEQGATQTADGFVSANDFHIREIPSFKTKLIVADQIIANKASISQLNAQKARIDELESDAITTTNLKAAIANIPTLDGIAAGFSGNVSCAGLLAQAVYIGGGTTYTNIGTGIQYVRISGPVNDVYTLQYKTFTGDWTDAGTFSRAARISLSGRWSGRSFIVTANDSQGTRCTGTVYGTLVPDDAGGVTYDSTNKNVKKTFIVYSDDNGDAGSRLFSQQVTISADQAYSDGYTKASPSSGSASGRSGSSYDWTFAIRKADGTSKNVTIDASPIYSDARSGYTQGIFTVQDIRLQGEECTVYITADSGGYDYYKASAKTKYYKAGTDVQYYLKGTSKDYYKGDGGSFTVQGASGPKLRLYGSQITLYKKNSDGTYTSAGSHNWYYQDNSNGTQYYKAGTTSVVARGTKVPVTAVGASVTVTRQGDEVSVTPVNLSSKIHLLSTIRYKAGTRYQSTYYKKS